MRGSIYGQDYGHARHEYTPPRARATGFWYGDDNQRNVQTYDDDGRNRTPRALHNILWIILLILLYQVVSILFSLKAPMIRCLVYTTAVVPTTELSHRKKNSKMIPVRVLVQQSVQVFGQSILDWRWSSLTNNNAYVRILEHHMCFTCRLFVVCPLIG